VPGHYGTTLRGRTTIGFGTQGVGLVPAREARMSLATTIWAECQIPNPNVETQNRRRVRPRGEDEPRHYIDIYGTPPA